jgi:integrase/recombinase XerD
MKTSSKTRTKTTTPVKKAKTAPLVPSVFSIGEIQGILNSFTLSVSGIRNRALVAIMFAGGLRVSEAINLMPSDIDPAKNEILIRNGKGGKTRRVGLLTDLLPFLQHWMEKRKALGFNGKEPIFCTFTNGTKRVQTGEAISADYVRGFLARLQKKMNLDKRLHSHSFRHSHANHLMESGKRLNTISAQLGHSSCSTTDKYLAKISSKELSEALAGIKTGITI